MSRGVVLSLFLTLTNPMQNYQIKRELPKKELYNTPVCPPGFECGPHVYKSSEKPDSPQ